MLVKLVEVVIGKHVVDRGHLGASVAKGRGISRLIVPIGLAEREMLGKLMLEILYDMIVICDCVKLELLYGFVLCL